MGGGGETRGSTTWGGGLEVTDCSRPGPWLPSWDGQLSLCPHLPGHFPEVLSPNCVRPAPMTSLRCCLGPYANLTGVSEGDCISPATALPAPSSTQTPMSRAKPRSPCPEPSCLKDAGSLGDGGANPQPEPILGCEASLRRCSGRCCWDWATKATFTEGQVRKDLRARV